MFCNKYNHSVDDKGRLIIPTEYRPELVGNDMTQSHNFYITTNLWDPKGRKEPCLCLWPEENFGELKAKLEDVSDSQESVRRFKRRFFSNTQSTALDKQGRISIVSDLKQYAGIDKNVMMIGMDKHIELWDYDAWMRYNGADEDEEDDEAWTETVGALGL